jgi:hypothetical protein
MLRLWVRLAVFALPLLLGWGVLEWGMRRVPNSNSVKRDRLAAVADGVETLVLGSSETYYGVAAGEFSSPAFNLANNSQTLYYDDQVLARVLPSLPKLRRVVIPISYFTLYYQLYDHDEDWRQYGYAQEWGIPPARSADRWDLRMWSRVALYAPRVALAAARARFRTNLAPETDAHGWYEVRDDVKVTWDLSAASCAEPLGRHHGWMKLVHEPANVASLEHILAQLRSRNVEAVLITPPVWPTYEAGMRPAYVERTAATIRRLQREYGVRYLSFLEEPRLHEEDFHDCAHLNAHGAKRFAHLLEAALDAPQPPQSTTPMRLETTSSSVPVPASGAAP